MVLTESLMMMPAASVCALCFAHEKVIESPWVPVDHIGSLRLSTLQSDKSIRTKLQTIRLVVGAQ